ncbi:MAG: hypothetical protein WC812_02560 [Candidatus Pacearchaeota archaeon]|jgi:hypothetical protein
MGNNFFESNELRIFSNARKTEGLKDLLFSGRELISPRQLISIQLNFKNENDLIKLREEQYETKTISLNKSWIDYKRNPTHYSFDKKPEIIIISSNQIKTLEMLCNFFKSSLSQDFLERYNLFEKEALKIPEEVINESLEELEYKLDKRIIIKNKIWKQKFIEFILEGDSKLIQDYIKYTEDITKKPFYDSLKIEFQDNAFEAHLLRINSAYISRYCFDINKKNAIVDPCFEFDDTSNGINYFGTRFIGVSQEFSKEQAKIFE